MRAAAKLRRRLSSTSPLISSPNPNNLSSAAVVPLQLFPFNHRRPSNLYPLPFSTTTTTTTTTTRCFSSSHHHAWTDEQEPYGGGSGEGAMKSSGTETAEIGGGGEGGVLSDIVIDDGSGQWYLPMIQPVIHLLDGFHDLTGLPWWVVIITSTLAFRTTLLPLLILQLKKSGEIAVLLPKLPPPFPPPQSGRSFREQYLLFRDKKRELACPSFMWNFASFFIQIPCFLLWMTSIRRMCLDNHPGFDSGGILWFQDLTVFPHNILGSIFPISVAGLHYINIQLSFRGSKVMDTQGILGLLAKYYKLYLDILAIPLLLIGFHIPQGSLVYWTTNSMLSSIQILSLRNPYVRKKLGLPDENHFKNRKTSIENGLRENNKLLEHDGRTFVKNKTSMENTLLESSSTLEHKISAEALSPDELLKLGLEYFAAGHLDEALPLLRLATEKDPELIKAFIAMGQISCSKGSLEESAEYFECAISKIPEETQEEELGLLVLALYGAGFSRISQGKKSQGIEHLKRIGELREPEKIVNKVCYYKALVLLGSRLFNDGEKSEAAKYLRRAAAYDPAINTMVKECEEG